MCVYHSLYLNSILHGTLRVCTSILRRTLHGTVCVCVYHSLYLTSISRRTLHGTLCVCVRVCVPLPVSQLYSAWDIAFLYVPLFCVGHCMGQCVCVYHSLYLTSISRRTLHGTLCVCVCVCVCVYHSLYLTSILHGRRTVCTPPSTDSTSV